MERLSLIWLALTAPINTIRQRTVIIQSAIDADERTKMLTELNAITATSWELMGISVGHYGDKVDVRAIEWFLKRAPDRMRKLLTAPHTSGN